MPKKMTTELFIERAVEKHKFKYDYSLLEYTISTDKVKIICKKHGEFLQQANSHLCGFGCPKCKAFKLKNLYEISHNEFLARFKTRQPFLFSNITILGVYKGANKKLLVNTKFGKCKVTPSSLLSGRNPSIVTAVDKTKYFIEQAKNVHGNTYRYNKSVFKSGKAKVNIFCNLCKLNFNQLAVAHLTGQGCPFCNFGIGFKRSQFINHCKKYKKQAVLYMIELKSKDELFYKIGITSRNIEKRLVQIPYERISYIVYHSTPEKIWDLEKQLHRQLKKEHFYKPLKPFGGETECFQYNKVVKDTFLNVIT